MRPLSQQAVDANRKQQKLILDLTAARAEIKRLTKERDEATSTLELVNSNNLTLCAELAGWKQTARQMEAERDLARAWVAKAFRMAMNETAKGPGFIDRIRELTPAHAQAALEAYGREKVREGMRMAAKIADQDSSAYHIRSEIRAEMETLK